MRDGGYGNRDAVLGVQAAVAHVSSGPWGNPAVP